MSISNAEVLQILQAAGQGNPAATRRMMEIQNSPDYYTALAQIVSEQSIETGLRQMAALQIKTGVTNPACVQNSNVQQSILNAIGDVHPQIRKIMATVIARGIASGAWPMNAIEYLTGKMQQQPTPEVTSGCVRALTYIIEDMVEALDVNGQALTLINLIVPLIVNPDPEIRDNALLSTCVFMEQAGMRNDGSCVVGLRPVVTSVVDSCLQLLQGQQGQLSNSSMFNCVKILVLSMTYNTEVMPYFNTLADMMNYIIVNVPLEDVRTEALQFWKAVLFFPSATEAAKPYMPKVIPMILNCMIYSPMELNMIGGKANDWQEVDRPEDIRPRHFQGRSRNFHHDEEDEDGQNDDGDTDWNLRRSAASTLDDISQVYGDAILNLALTTINEMMQPSRPWQEQEAAILAIGAICEGCYDGLKSYMAAIIQRLISVANDETYHHLARQICCWTIGQMNEFILEKENANLLQQNLSTLLALMKAPTKSVQESATAALQRLLEAANNNSDNYGALQVEGCMRAIVETCSACLENYQLKNRQLLLECIESVCSYYGTELAIGETFGLLMTPLGKLWSETPDNSHLIFAYFECMAAVCSAFGRAIESYAQSIFDRTVAIIITHTELRYNAKHSQQEADVPDEEYLITALDLLSSLFDAMGSSLEPLLKNQPRLMECIIQSMRDESPDIQKASFALIGDLSGACPGIVQSNLEVVCNLMIARLKDVDERRSGAASNVAWALAVLIEHQMDIGGLPTLGPNHYDAFLQALGRLLVNTEFTTDMVNLAENACLAIGCILLVDPQALQRTGANLGFFASRWCEYVRNIKNVPLKDRALRGFLSAAQASPAALTEALLPLFDVCASVCHDAASDMKQGIRGLLQTLKTNASGPWNNAMGRARPETKQKLHVAYGV